VSFHAICLLLYRERSAARRMPEHTREHDESECRYLAGLLIGKGC
jgi:hypothetical protein